MELGCGLGLTGVVACRTCGLRSYAFTDCHPQVLFLLAKNIETNLAHPPPSSSSSSSSQQPQPDSRDKKMFRKIKRQLSLTTDKTDVSCAASGDHIRGGSGEDLEVQPVLSPDKPDNSAAAEENREEEDEDEISVSEDDELRSVGGVGTKLELSDAHWETDGMQARAVLRGDPRVSVCRLDWERTPPHILGPLQADVILGAGRLSLPFLFV